MGCSQHDPHQTVRDSMSGDILAKGSSKGYYDIRKEG